MVNFVGQVPTSLEIPSFYLREIDREIFFVGRYVFCRHLLKGLRTALKISQRPRSPVVKTVSGHKLYDGLTRQVISRHHSSW